MTKKSKVRNYRGEAITVSFDARRCIHAARCVRDLPQVFDVDRRPWIHPDGAPAARVAEVVRACPTGALQYEAAAGVEAERPEEPNTITVRPNGSLHFRGDLSFARPEGGESRDETPEPPRETARAEPHRRFEVTREVGIREILHCATRAPQNIADLPNEGQGLGLDIRITAAGQALDQPDKAVLTAFVGKD